MTKSMPRLAALSVATAVVLFPACEFIEWHYIGPDPTGGHPTSTGSTSTMGATGSGPSLCTAGSMQPCYDGPAGTEGVGTCKGGAQTCALDGMSWGACVGEVLPKLEDCAKSEDEDCDGNAPTCQGNLLWAKRFGDVGDDHALGIAVDPGGGVLVTGYFSGSVDFGGGVLTSAGGADIFVLKLDGNGNHLWSKRFGGAADDGGTSVAVDATGHVLVTGYFSGSADFGGGTLTSAGATDIFVLKLDATGGNVWSKRFGDSDFQQGASVAVDGAGSVLVTGYVSGSADFGGGKLTSAGSSDAFLVKLDGSGNHTWSKLFGDGNFQRGTGVAVDSAGGVLLTGTFGGSIDLGGGQLPCAGSGDVFVAKLDGSGNHLWSKAFGDSNDQQATSVASDGAGNAVVTGYFWGSVDFGGGKLTSKSGQEVFVAKLDASSGGYLWGKSFGDGGQTGASVAADAVGNVVLTGAMLGQMDFGGGPIASAGGKDAFVAKLDGGDAGYQWGKRFGDAAHDQFGQAVATDGQQNVLIAGYFTGSMNFGASGNLMSAGGSDIFVAKLSQ